MRGRKGFVFSVDALLAVILLMMFVLAFSFFSASAMENPYILLVLEKQADDALTVLDKTERLETMSPAIMGDSLDRMLIPSLSWNMYVEYYNYSGGLMHVGNFSFGGDYGDADRIVIAERMFVVFDDNRTYGTTRPVKYYGMARLRLWAG